MVFDESIHGEFIDLYKVNIMDAADIYRWRTSISGQYLNQPPGYTIESQEQWIRSRDDREMNYIIRDDEEKVGMISIYDVSYPVSNVGRLILDEKYLNKGTPYGLEALLLTYDYVFNVMDIPKISGTILGRNKKVFDLQKYLGMIQEGYLKNHVLLNGNLEDLYVMSLFRDDFYKYAERINIILNKFR